MIVSAVLIANFSGPCLCVVNHLIIFDAETLLSNTYCMKLMYAILYDCVYAHMCV